MSVGKADRINVLITGASTGIGEACARWLDSRGHRVFAGVRTAAAAERLRSGSSGPITPLTLDVADAESIAAARSKVETALDGAGLHGLVNNAGIAVAGPLEHVPIEAFRRQLEVNVTGQVAVTQAFLPLIRLGHGRIVFMGSIGGRLSTPFLAPYSASKFALEAIADALRVEVQPWGVGVSIVEPGSIATPIWTKSAFDTSLLSADRIEAMQRDYGAAINAFRSAAESTGARGLPPDTVAAAVEHALVGGSPRTRYVVGRDARIQIALRRWVPDRLRDRLLTRALKLPRRGSA